MKATKFMVEVQAEALSKDTLPGLLSEAARMIQNEIENAYLRMDDGDTIRLTITKENVEF